MPCDPYINPDWSPEFAVLAASMDEIGIHWQQDFLNALDLWGRSMRMSKFEYVVVSGTPSEDLDVNGRKEINAGNTIIDLRFAEGNITPALICTAGAAYNAGDFDFTDETSTITNNRADYGVGQIIAVFYQ